MKRIILSFLIATCAICTQAVSITLKPGLTCDTTGCTYYLNFKMPSFSIAADTLPGLHGDEYFSHIEPDAPYEFDYLEEDGRPSLPFCSTNLILPPDASNLMVRNVQIFDSIILHMPYDYTPAQQRIDFSNGISYDGDYYGSFNNTWYWMYDTIRELDYRNYKGFCLSIFPCRYEPYSNTLIVITEATFEVSYDGTGISEYIQMGLCEHDRFAFNFFDNFEFYPYPTLPPIDQDEFLIITADAWENNADLADFILHKESLGYSVTLAALHTTGHTPDSIRNFIRSQYFEKATKYVLLIGTVDDGSINYKLPFYDGQDSTMNDPSSDIYYSCLSRTYTSSQRWDFTPTVFVGRWPVQNANQLKNVIVKTISSDLHLGTFNPQKITLFSGKDPCSSYMENYFYDDCQYINKNIIQECDYYTGEVVDGRDGVDYFTMKDYMENQADPIWLFVYDGHAGSTFIGEPYYLFNSSIGLITTSTLDFQPFGFGFACKLGNIFNPNNFARAWLTSTEGGVTFLGATTSTTNISDRYFSRDLFNQLKKEESMTIGEFIGNGKAKYFCSGHKVVWRRKEAKKYNLYGDPSLYLHGLLFDTAPYPALPKLPKKEEQQDDIVDDILHLGMTREAPIFVYSITGQLMLKGSTSQLDLRELPTGMYTVIINADNQQYSKKIIKL